MGKNTDFVWSVPSPDVFIVCRYLEDEFVGTSWMRNLLRKEQFHEKVVELFVDEFDPVIEAKLDGLVAQYEKTIAAAFALNRIRWQSELDSREIHEELTQVSDYIHAHICFWYRAWVKEVPYCQVSFLNIPNNQFRSIVAGQKLESMPVVEDTQTQVFLG